MEKKQCLNKRKMRLVTHLIGYALTASGLLLGCMKPIGINAVVKFQLMLLLVIQGVRNERMEKTNNHGDGAGGWRN
jgi:hypothetical protein